MSLRLVSRVVPLTQKLWEETYIPFVLVASPLVDIDDEDEDASENKDDSSEEQDNSFAQPLSSVIKCLYCGAPLPTTTTHFRYKGLSSKVLCYLCGETSSVLISDQQAVRRNEYLDPALFDKVEYLSPQEKRDISDQEALSDFSTDTIDFRVPIVEKPPPSEDLDDRDYLKALKKNASLATWQLPAMACPPVWWIVVDGTVGSPTNGIGPTRNYWETVGATLTRALEEIPPHVHVGLITATGSRLASWDLTSAVPHVQNYSYSYDPSDGGQGDGPESEEHYEAWNLCLVPANGAYRANLEAAIRAMVDGAVSGLFWNDDLSSDGEEEASGEKGTTSNNIPLGLTLEILLEFMEQGSHPGQDPEEDDDDEDEMTKLRYAGGKILCLLGNPPLETNTPPKDDSPSYIGQPAFGAGGVAGSCRSVNDDDEDEMPNMTVSRRRKSKKNDTKKEEEESKTDPTDFTSSNLHDYALQLEPDDLFVKIGSRCAKAALGVDLIVLVPEEDEAPKDKKLMSTKSNIPWYGLPLLRPLSDSSGAPGPLMFGTGNIGDAEGIEDEEKKDDGEASLSSETEKYVEKFERLHENILARTPWQSGMVFGVQMKLRLSPGFKVENSPIEKTVSGKFQLARFFTSGGLTGPAVVASADEEGNENNGEDEDDSGEEGLWIMGSCDPHTSVCIDLDVDEEGMPKDTDMDGFGEVDMHPVMQTCTLFTCVETDGAEPTPNYYTVCKIRVSSIPLQYAEDREDIFDGIDPEALSVVLFNKIALDAYLTGFKEAQNTTEDWLRSTLVSVYESAKEKKAKLEENRRLESKIDFVAADRLLDLKGGTLSESEILLGEGHLKTRFLALLAYAISQSDALRPSGQGFNPSMDARLCAIANLSSMTPRTLAKTFAPSLSLWSIKDDEAIVDSLPLSKEGILDVLDELEEENLDTAVLLLDSTQGVLMFTAEDLEDEDDRKTVKKAPQSSAQQPVMIGPDLESTMLESLAGYRTPPPQWKVLESFARGDPVNIQVSPSTLRSMLIEDRPTFSGDKDFLSWKTKMADSIMEEIEANEERDKRAQTASSWRFWVRK